MIPEHHGPDAHSPIEHIVTDPFYKQKVLDRKRVGVQVPLSSYVVRSAQFDLVKIAGEELLLTLAAEVLSEKVESRTQIAELNVPYDWWEHFKLDNASKWWLRWYVKRHPVRYETRRKEVRFERYRHYPDAHIALPEDKFGQPIIYEQVTHGNWLP